MSNTLEGKSAIVTGAGGGISLAFTRLLLARGVNVLLADLTLRPESQAVIDQYQDKPKAIFQKTDVSSWRDLSDLFVKAEEIFGTIDIVCPGAGIFEPPSSAFWYPPGSVQSKDDPFGGGYKTLDVNLTHPIRLTQLAISHFLSSTPTVSKTSSCKNIIHIVSVACEVAHLSFPLYHATKWGLAGFIRSHAQLEPEMGIRIAGVAPGAVKTPLWTDSKEKMILVTKDGEIQRSWVMPEFVAEQMLAIVTGSEMTSVDGSPIVPTGGLLLEIGASHVREIPLFNNPGPDGNLPGMMAVNITAAQDEALRQLRAPGWGRLS